jgi:16S rRNA (guanine966-N2)-methyltransferase
MRIISGKLGGRNLKNTKGLKMRPSSERVREAMFSSLESSIDLMGIRVLDLYAGSGALGIEALSRGAASCVFVEYNKNTAKTLKTNLENLGVSAQSKVVCANVRKYLSTASSKEAFDLVFADPPYGLVSCEQELEQLAGSGLIKDGTVLIFESDQGPLELGPGLEKLVRLSSEKNYGDTVVSSFKFTKEQESA